jgi:hypothetical protein
MKTRNILLTIATLALLASCTDKFAEISRDHYNAHEADMAEDNLKIGAMFQQLERSVIIYRDGTYLDSDYQIAYNLTAETWCGYMGSTHTSANSVQNSGWNVYDQYHRRLFTVKYEYGMAAFTNIKKECEKNHLPLPLALATVVKVATMHQVTDYYGPIAYSQTGSVSGNLYDSQEDVYKAFFTELDGAIDALEPYVGTKIMETYDLVYGGDITKWVQFANSLRLRLAMRVVYADAALARTEAEKSIASLTGVITGNSGNAVVQEVDHHPLYEINVKFNDGDTQMGASMDCYLNGYNDPRKFLIAKPAEGDGQLHGVRAGIDPANWNDYKNSSGKVSAPNATKYKICWLNAAEVAFLRAEGAVRGWNMGGTAKDFYEQGIALSFEEWGAEGATAYIANSTAQPAAFTDNVGSANASSPSSVTIAWNEAGTEEQKLEKIGTQKWIALFPNGCEGWAEYRRLHYPVLIQPANNFSNGVVNSARQMRRVPYPLSEASDNPDGYASGVAALGGEDNAGTRLWWDQKPF